MADPENPPLPGKLPVTAEIGSEGGSYADATVQAETFGGTNDPEEPQILRDTPPNDDTQESPAEGMRKYPTE